MDTLISPSSNRRQFAQPILCVDLDGTLIHSDLLLESALSLIGRNPLKIFSMFFWLLAGKANLKKQIASQTKLEVSDLPYNQSLIDWIRPQRDIRQIVLCTASDAILAQKVADYTDLFDAVIASDGKTNMTGRTKADALVLRFGERGFDYVGNARIDMAVWCHARSAIVVESGSSLSKAASKVTEVHRRFEVPRAGFTTWMKALRVHQWIKNILVFLPILVAHMFFDVFAVIQAGLAFVSFGLCASSVYVTNDLLDLASDRRHHRKRSRPFASGLIPLGMGPLAALFALVAAFTVALFVSSPFAWVLFGYYLLTSAYSFRLKRIMMLDVIVLAMLYTTRILAGAAATGTVPSFWLLAFSMFIFLSLAMIKRYTELVTTSQAGKFETNGRGYNVDDIPLIQSMGSSSGYLAVLVMALYIDSTASESLYKHQHLLWLLCPLLLYWISRAWAIAHRGGMHDDPIVFAVMDKTSRLIIIIAGLIICFAI